MSQSNTQALSSPSNITKFFGDWHLARVYENVSARFHLADWHKTIDSKLKTLDDLYQLLKRRLEGTRSSRSLTRTPPRDES